MVVELGLTAEVAGVRREKIVGEHKSWRTACLEAWAAGGRGAPEPPGADVFDRFARAAA